ncbi:metal ABC transporter substrate-binding protein [Treponema zioleckii]|uniref:metal ABC transporter substrate-binding protein n=1 Tax=Treponema zioleckii TaxID=331680 RepID=UPI0024130C7F|nr:metal ABC transporter substrate-binding protein [Treponema zioleckii]
MKLNKLFVLAGVLFTLASAAVFAKAKSNSDGEKIKVVATIFPEYDWAKEIIGAKADNVELTLLLNNGTDLHSYSPSFDDIAKVSNADIFIYVGGESDEWVDKVLKNAKNPKIRVVNLLETLGNRVKNEEVVEGMEHEHDDHDEHEEHDEHDEHDEHEGHHHDEEEKDEHVWLSLRNAKILSSAIFDALCEKNPKDAAAYKANLAS